MAISPYATTDIDVELDSEEVIPSLTYGFDFSRGEFTNTLVDDLDALMQHIRKMLVTPRYRHLIYNDEIGSEVEDLIGESPSPALVKSELPRMIKEALVYDDRIKDVIEFTSEIIDDEVYVTFTVETEDGQTLNVEEVLK